MRRGDAFSKSNWGVVAFSVQIHGANILIIGERDAWELLWQNLPSTF